VPQRFLSTLPALNADDWWDHYENEQLRRDLNYEIMGKVSKSVIVARARQNLESVRTWAEKKEGSAGDPYDFGRDRAGVVRGSRRRMRSRERTRSRWRRRPTWPPSSLSSRR
jgi:outer membrane protein TolC